MLQADWAPNIRTANIRTEAAPKWEYLRNKLLVLKYPYTKG